jgi:hypothetical protein
MRRGLSWPCVCGSHARLADDWGRWVYDPDTHFPICVHCGALCPESDQLSPAIGRRLGRQKMRKKHALIAEGGYGSLPSRWRRWGRERREKDAVLDGTPHETREVWLAEGAKVVAQTITRFSSGLTWDQLREALSRFCWGSSMQPKYLRLYLQRCLETGTIEVVVGDGGLARYRPSASEQ